MSDGLCLAVDLGTGGPKVGLVTLSGELVATELHAVTTTTAPGGLATQDAEGWWRLVAEASRRLLAADPARAARVRAVAVTGQWATTVPADERGVPVGPAIQWSDTRGRRHARQRFGGRVLGYAPTTLYRFLRRNGGTPDLAGGDPIGHALHLMADEPETYARARWLLEPVDYLTMRFTGVASASHASMLATWLLDTRDCRRLAYDPVLCRLAGVDAARLPPLREIGSVVGPVAPGVARDLGLPDDAVAITGLPDLHAAALGTGATRLGDTHLALSTTSWISCPVARKRTDVRHLQQSVPGLTNGTYLVANSQNTGARCLEWLRSSTLLGTGAPPGYGELCALAATSTPGAGGVLFTPWLAGERSPVGDLGARGGFRGLSLATTPADLVRSVLEGVALNSRWLLGATERFAGQALSPIRLLGGGAQSPEWCQVYADVLGREVVQTADPMYAQLRGMAVMAGVALGEHGLDDVASLLPGGRVFEPDERARARYDQLAPLLEQVIGAERDTVRTLRHLGDR